MPSSEEIVVLAIVNSLVMTSVPRRLLVLARPAGV